MLWFYITSSYELFYEIFTQLLIFHGLLCLLRKKCTWLNPDFSTYEEKLVQLSYKSLVILLVFSLHNDAQFFYMCTLFVSRSQNMLINPSLKKVSKITQIPTFHFNIVRSFKCSVYVQRFVCKWVPFFNGISTFAGYLMPKLISKNNSSGTI